MLQNIGIEEWYFLALKEKKREIPLHFCVSGISMTPLIRNNMDEVIVLPRTSPVKKGDIVLVRAQLRQAHYMLHRVYKIQGDMVQTLGDGNIKVDPWIPISDVIGIAVGMKRNGKWVNFQSLPLHLWGRLWMLLFPIRDRLITWYLK